MSQIIGINCVYGVLVSFIDLANILGVEVEVGVEVELDHSTEIAAEDLNNLSRALPTGLSLFRNPEWDADVILLGVTIFKLDVDPSQNGSRIAPVITLPDAIDFSPFTDSQALYYQIPIYEDDEFREN